MRLHKMTIKQLYEYADKRLGPAANYILGSLERAYSLLDLEALQIRGVEFLPGLGSRGAWDDDTRMVLLDPDAKCFQPDYKGYKYKTFDRRWDLTPGGVFLHECGHALTFWHPSIIGDFRELRSDPILEEPITRYASTRVYEDIAESFRLYVSNPELLDLLAPLRFGILERYARIYLR